MEPIYKTHNEAMRQLLELAIACGRSWQSSQTGYIHYNYSLHDEHLHQPIPLYENLLFVLALMRSRNMENIQDSKTLLSQLLHFQSHEEGMTGNFPIYLHEYPVCKDKLYGAHLLAPLYWIYKNFHHVLGTELKQSVKVALVKLQIYCLKTIEEIKKPYPIALKIAASAVSIGALLHQSDMLHQGETLLKELQDNPDRTAWYSPTSLSDLIIAHQMLPQNVEVDAFWQHLTETWHPLLAAYCGPGWKEFQQGTEPQVTLYDFFMGYLYGGYAHRCFADRLVQLQAALLHPMEYALPVFQPPMESSGTIRSLQWKAVMHNKMAFSVLSKDTNVVPVQERSFLPLKLIWGTLQRLHSFVCQGGTSQRIDFAYQGNQVEIFFSFLDALQTEETEKNQEISFYLDENPNLSIRVEGSAATTFQVGEEVVITDGKVKMALKFQVHSGDGEFFGHIMKANRPCQLDTKGPDRFAVFDWQIFLRTIKRSDFCTVKATLTINSLE